MIDSIKVTEVTDTITPAEETYPPNYNFEIASEWDEETFTKGGGGEEPTGTIQITENGTHDVKQYASAEVQVPNPSTGSQTFTENGTYDVTSLAEAVVNVQASGGDTLADRFTNKLTEYSNDEITTLPTSAFNGCSNLTSIDLPNLTSIGAYCFSGCSKLEHARFDKLTSVATNGYCFQNTTNLSVLVLKSLKTLDQRAFYGSSGLQTVDLVSATSIGYNCFQQSKKLKTLILRSPTVCTLVDNMQDTPFGGAYGTTYGTIYVPQALIESYRTATNWSSLVAEGKNTLLPIEGSIYETQYADGRLISEVDAA